MKNLFNNPWFIGVLAIASLLLVFRSVATPFFEDDAPVGVIYADGVEEEWEDEWEDDGGSDDTSEYDIDEVLEQPPQKSPPNSILNGGLTWNSDPRRDPFSARFSVEIAASDPSPDASPESRDPYPQLDALVAGPDSLFAVIDDEVVTIGDRVGEFEVTRISPDGVLLRTHDRSAWISLP